MNRKPRRNGAGADALSQQQSHETECRSRPEDEHPLEQLGFGGLKIRLPLGDDPIDPRIHFGDSLLQLRIESCEVQLVELTKVRAVRSVHGVQHKQLASCGGEIPVARAPAGSQPVHEFVGYIFAQAFVELPAKVRCHPCVLSNISRVFSKLCRI